MNRLPLILLLCLAHGTALAVGRIEIHAGEIRHPAATVGNLDATLDIDGRWRGKATLKQGDVALLAREYSLPVTVGKGTLQGKAEFSGEQRALRRIKGEFQLKEAAFSDEAGLHAGDKIDARVTMDASRDGSRWNWSGMLEWTGGEIFWQPIYLAQGGVGLQGRGWLADDMLVLENARLTMDGVGTVSASATIRRPGNGIEALDVAADNLDMGGAYSNLLKPLLEKTMLGNLDMAGHADVRLTMRDGGLRMFDLALHEFDVEDASGRFALYKVNARVPWTLNNPTQANLQYAGGHLLKMQLGPTDLAATLNGYSLTAPVLRLPILDGVLTLNDISAAFLHNQWHWHLGASLSPVSMADFSHAVGWPAMQGKVAAGIPMVTYTNGMMTADGAMGLDVFDGSVTVRNLALQNPLGLAPRLQADIRMRDLDLDLLTRTFSFGAMTGRLDGDVNGLVLSRWQPVQFDASFRSSEGRYPKKISQRAVENISALGGAGAAAAIQRSFLRFFKEFNYAKIGLSCKLRNGVCRMDGIEPAQSGYVIVKGSGVPAITVLGYNRSVSWGELLERVQRITQGNTKPVIK